MSVLRLMFGSGTYSPLLHNIRTTFDQTELLYWANVLYKAIEMLALTIQDDVVNREPIYITIKSVGKRAHFRFSYFSLISYLLTTEQNP